VETTQIGSNELAAYNRLSTVEKEQLVLKLLQHLKAKEKEIEHLKEDVHLLSKANQVSDQLRTLSSLTGVLNLCKDDKEVLTLFESILFSLLNSFKELKIHNHFYLD
jgi:hypothetical protein